MKRFAILLFTLTSLQSAFSQKTGLLNDERDGKVYKTVIIDGTEWMAENLDYEVRGSFCYEDKVENCDIYGRIYTWPLLMMNSSAESSRGVCPNGWHVPTDGEWSKLDNSVKRAKDLAIGGVTGFNIVFAGSRFTEGNYGFLGQCATFWTSTEDEESNKFAWTRYVYQDKLYKSTARYSTNKMYGQSVRCVKNK